MLINTKIYTVEYDKKGLPIIKKQIGSSTKKNTNNILK